MFVLSFYVQTYKGSVCNPCKKSFEFEFEWGVYTQSASEAIFRARGYSHKLFRPVIMKIEN